MFYRPPQYVQILHILLYVSSGAALRNYCYRVCEIGNRGDPIFFRTTRVTSIFHSGVPLEKSGRPPYFKSRKRFAYLIAFLDWCIIPYHCDKMYQHINCYDD
jgi:hypothetical protein